jgi:polyisoprenoid-binding protein YceI
VVLAVAGGSTPAPAPDLDGELTVRGVSQPVTLAIDSVETTGQGFRARATTPIDRYAFGLTVARGLAARYVEVELIVAAEPT